MNLDKNKRKKFLLLFSVCFAIILVLCVVMFWIFNEAIRPNVYPWAWQNMNAVLVRWGMLPDVVGPDYDTGEYVRVSVEFVVVYTVTMETEDPVMQYGYLRIHKSDLAKVRYKDMALVFLTQTGTEIVQDVDGTEREVPVFTVLRGAQIDDGAYAPSPIFGIENDRVVVTEEFYAKNPSNGAYYCSIMEKLEAANEYVKQGGAQEFPLFEDGMQTGDLPYFFAFVCKAGVFLH